MGKKKFFIPAQEVKSTEEKKKNSTGNEPPKSRKKLTSTSAEGTLHPGEATLPTLSFSRKPRDSSLNYVKEQTTHREMKKREREREREREMRERGMLVG